MQSIATESRSGWGQKKFWGVMDMFIIFIIVLSWAHMCHQIVYLRQAVKYRHTTKPKCLLMVECYKR